MPPFDYDVSVAVARGEFGAEVVLDIEVENLVATAWDGEVELSWTDPDDEIVESILVSWAPDGDDGATVRRGVEAYTVGGLSNGTEYNFTVRTVDTAGNTSAGVQIAATPDAIDPDAPGPVTDLTATPSDGAVALRWSDPTDDDLDRIEITRTPDGGGPLSVPAATESFTARELTNGTSYTFTFRAVDTEGNRSAQVTVSATPGASGAEELPATGTEIDISFEDPANPSVTLSASDVQRGSLLTVSVEETFGSYDWYLNGTQTSPALSTSGQSAVVDTTSLRLGTHTISVFVDGDEYSAQVRFNVVQP